MGAPQQIQPMPKEISALNTYWLVQYLQDKHPELDFAKLFSRVKASMPCYVENIYTGKIEAISLTHLQNPRYWFSHEFVKALHDQVEEEIPDSRLGYKIGATMYKTQPLVRTALGLSLLGVQKVAAKISSEAAKYNCTKEYHIREMKKGYVEIRIIHNPGIVISEFTMQWNAGCFASYAKMAGANEVAIDLKCIDPGPVQAGEDKQAIWDFYISYQEPHLVKRVAKALLRCLPWIRQLTENAEVIEAEHQDQILYRDRIIQERTDKLLKIQQRLIDEERRNIESKLRNISRELVSTEERERKAIAEDLHDSVTQLLALSISRVRSLAHKSDDPEEFRELQEYLEQSIAELRSLTFQISPPVLYDFGLEAALQWLVEDVNNKYGMKLIFTCLTQDALPFDREQRAVLYRVIRELVINIIKHAATPNGQIILRTEDDVFIATVEDEGVGFDANSEKSGFGLATLTDRLICLRGRVQIDSCPGEGTIVTISVPLVEISEKRSGILPETAQQLIGDSSMKVLPN